MLPARVELSAVVVSIIALTAMQQPILRPPAVPLVVHDPYFSIWSFVDKLTDDWPRHWTGAINGMCGMIRINGRTYRWMGLGLGDVPPMPQLGIEILMTKTVYVFEHDGVRLMVTFSADQLATTNYEARFVPITTIKLRLERLSVDPRDVSVYFDTSAEAAVHTADQRVMWSLVGEDPQVLQFTCIDGEPLARVGDNVRIDWGSYVIAGHKPWRAGFSTADDSRLAFVNSVRPEGSMEMPRRVDDRWPVAYFVADIGDPRSPRELALQVGYDHELHIEYFGRRLPPLHGSVFDKLASHSHFPESDKIADEIQKHATAIGGPKYAALCALVYRHVYGAYGIVRDFNGDLLMFSKENFSNGCIGTVDVTYPTSPFFLVFDVTLLEAQLRPILDYAMSPRWKFDFAPHDLGTYPKANGQVYGGGERSEENQMPVEECGNMLIMISAMDILKGHAPFGGKYWEKLDQWAEYLLKNGLDPGNQLCTDDFAGHLAHNANLAVKAIVALGAYGKHCEKQGRKPEADRYGEAARNMVQKWIELADDGDHFRLAYDKPGTWSQKYNLIWDKVLDLKLFPQEVFDKEVAYYKTKIARYGLPLDNRADYTKLDWCVWTACLSQSKSDFELFMEPVYRFINETPDRVPLTDWYSTKDARKVGFQARSVVGAVYMPFLIREWK